MKEELINLVIVINGKAIEVSMDRSDATDLYLQLKNILIYDEKQ